MGETETLIEKSRLTLLEYRKNFNADRNIGRIAEKNLGKPWYMVRYLNGGKYEHSIAIELIGGYGTTTESHVEKIRNREMKPFSHSIHTYRFRKN